MKRFLLALVLFWSFNGIAQNLENKIPGTAKAVIEVNGNRIFELLPLSVINNADFVQDLFKKAKVQKIQDYGFDLDSKAYYFYQTFGDNQYHNVMIKLSDKSKFEALLPDYKKKDIQKIDGNNYIFQGKTTTAWNDHLLLITIHITPTSYPYSLSNFERMEVDQPVVKISDKENDIEEVESVEEVKEVEVKVVQEAQEVDDIEEEEVKYVESVNDNGKSKEEAMRLVSDLIEKQNADKLRRNKENKAYVTALLTEYASSPITKNSSYSSGKNKKAAAYMWIANYGEMIDDFNKLSSPFQSYKSKISYKKLSGIEAMRSNLFFDKDEIRVAGEFEMTDEKAAQTKKIYDSKLNKNFYRYFDQKDVLAYISSSINMEEMLKMYPQIIKDMYGGMLPQYNEEVDVTADLISILLDEKAIGELITGDALLVLNKIEEQEVSYTTYKYDENYKRTKITKTKKQTLPVFTIMLGSENKAFVEKLLKLSMKYKMLDFENRFYVLNKKLTKSPIDLYFVVQDGIVFLSNSKNQIKKIASKTIDSDLGKHKRFLKKYVATVYINTEKLIAQVPKDKMGRKGSEMSKLIQSDIKETYMTFSKVKGNKIYANSVTKTSNRSENSLHLLFSLIGNLVHANK